MKSNGVTNQQRRQIRQLIREEFMRKKVINERVENVCQKMVIYENKALRLGRSQEEINEGLVEIINEGMMGDVAFDMVKRFLGGKLLNFLGLNKSEHPVLFTFFQNVLEAINYTEITKYFGAGSCPNLMEMLTEAITETVTEMGGEKIISFVATKFLPTGTASAITGALDSSLANVSQEAINEVVVGIVKGYLQEPMGEFVCEGKLMDAVSGLFGGGEEGGEGGFDFGDMALGAIGDFAGGKILKSLVGDE